MTKRKKQLTLTLIAIAILLCARQFSPWWWKDTPPAHPYGYVGQITPPNGFDRISVESNDYAEYVRQLPLSPEDSLIRLYGGEWADTIQKYRYRVIDIALLDSIEQCADVCIRLRSEYLYSNRLYYKLHYDDNEGKTIWFKWGNNRPKFERFLRYVYRYANSESLKKELNRRPINEIQPGDLFIFDAKTRGTKYGHAILVADVAYHRSTGQLALLLLQGSTPACSIHIMNNTTDSVHSPWFLIDVTKDSLDFGIAKYAPTELFCFE